nr:AAA family ATPase [Methylobacterium cerastii]
MRNLFGKLNYPNIPIRNSADLNRIAVMYGDNGTGKTTILKLIYACLSWQTNAGLRSIIAKTPFIEFRIDFTDGGYVKVSKENLQGSFKFEIHTLDRRSEYDIIAENDIKVRDQPAITMLERGLRELNFDLLFVDHNRNVLSTYSFIDDSYLGPMYLEETEAEALSLHAHETIHFQHGIVRRDKDLQFPLPQVVDALNQRFRVEAYQQGAAGDQNAASVYLEIAKSIGRDRRGQTAAPTTVNVLDQLEELKEKSKSYIKHGLLSNYPYNEFAQIYTSAPKTKKGSIEAVLGPFLDSIRRRISALEQIHSVITTFESELAKYLKNKIVNCGVPSGLNIYDEDGEIELDDLSSGEKQLVFLLCSAVIARSKKTIILIDEPELSLNYKWQRLIAGSLASLSAGGETQYILASHSIEIITRYVDNSFELVS